MIRVLVVDDSLTVRKTVSERLRAAGIEVIGEAADGREALIQTHELRPDVVLMDVVMPGVDGLDATRRIMAEIPTPVVILSGHATRQEVFKTYDALAAGALEVCSKPVTASLQGQAEWDRIFLTVRAAAQVAVMRLRHHADYPAAGKKPQAGSPLRAAGRPPPKLVVMGASTGGPAAIKEILGSLPRNFPLPIILALHCSSRLSSSVAGWFDRDCVLNVSDAEHGVPLPRGPGVVLTAPPGHNLRVCMGQTVLDDIVGDTGCTPSVDELFTSAATNIGDGIIGVLLTGMGADGAEGLKLIRDRGGCTIAQDEDSCVVFGMPAAAIKLDAAENITPLGEIAALLNVLAGVPQVAHQTPGVYS